MATFDTSQAQAVHVDGILAGYIMQHTETLWLPLSTNGENLSGPTYEADARNIVIHKFQKRI